MIKFDTLTLYTLEETAEKIPVTLATIRKYLREGRLIGQKVGGKWYVDEKSIRAYYGASSVVSSDEDKPKG